MGLESLAGMADAAHEDTKDVLMTRWQYSHDRQMQDRSFVRQKDLNRQMAALAADARRNSYSDAVEGAKRAGLHPSVASGASFGSVSSGGSSPAPSSSGYSSAPLGLGALALEARKFDEAQRANLDAQTRNLNAEAEGQELKNQNQKSSNAALDKLLRDRLNDEKARMDKFASQGGDSDAIKESDQYKVVSTLLEQPLLNQGVVDALSNYFGSEERSVEHSIKILAGKIEKEIKSKQLFDSEFSDKLAALPKHEADIAANSAAEIYANILYLAMARQLTEANTDLAEKSIDQIEEAIKVMQHNDVVGLFESGNYDALGVKFVYEKLPQMLNSLGLAGLVTQFGRRARSGSNKPAKVGDSPMQMLGY